VDLPGAGALGARGAPRGGRAAGRRLIVELGFAGVDWLVRETLKEAGDAVVLEPAAARDAVRQAAESIGAADGPGRGHLG